MPRITPKPSKDGSGEAEERCLSPPAAAFSLGMLVPVKRFASRVDPRTRILAFHTYGGPGSMLIVMVHRGRISFHEEED
jgi:hypothetical protein